MPFYAVPPPPPLPSLACFPSLPLPLPPLSSPPLPPPHPTLPCDLHLSQVSLLRARNHERTRSRDSALPRYRHHARLAPRRRHTWSGEYRSLQDSKGITHTRRRRANELCPTRRRTLQHMSKKPRWMPGRWRSALTTFTYSKHTLHLLYKGIPSHTAQRWSWICRATKRATTSTRCRSKRTLQQQHISKHYPLLYKVQQPQQQQIMKTESGFPRAAWRQLRRTRRKLPPCCRKRASFCQGRTTSDSSRHP